VGHRRFAELLAVCHAPRLGALPAPGGVAMAWPAGPARRRLHGMLCLLVAAVPWGSSSLDAAAEVAVTAPTALSRASTEAEALALLMAPGGQGLAAAKAWDPSEAGRLISRSWWSASKELVRAFQQEANTARTVALDSAVRKQVGALRQSADDLLLALSPQESERIGVVRCASQWAQNSTAIFLTVKFAHRWSSPGALKLHDESMNVSSCCLNFSASGEHSQLRKRYALDLHLFGDVLEDAWSWQHASAGRVTVEIGKAKPAAWPRLVRSTSRPANLGVWDAMESKWQSELRDFGKAEKRQNKEAKSAQADPEAAEADDEALHDEFSRTCFNNATSPFFKNRQIAVLCDTYWPPRMKGKLGRSTTWLVLFYSPSEMKCDDHSAKCTTTGDRWLAVGKKIPQVSPDAKVGAVNCDLHASFCSAQDVGHMPYVRRYKAGKRKILYGDWDIDSLMQFIRS